MRMSNKHEDVFTLVQIDLSPQSSVHIQITFDLDRWLTRQCERPHRISIKKKEVELELVMAAIERAFQLYDKDISLEVPLFKLSMFQDIHIGGFGIENCGLTEEQRLLVQRFDPLDMEKRELCADRQLSDCDTIGFFIAKFVKNESTIE